MKIINHVTASIPKSIYFTLDEVEIILKLLKMKLLYSTEKEVSKIESLVRGFESLLSELHEQEQYKAEYFESLLSELHERKQHEAELNLHF